MKAAFCLFLICVQLAFGIKTKTQSTHTELNFLVVGDWGSYNEYNEYSQNQVQVAEQMAQVAQATNPSFVISVGDNFYETGAQSPDDPIFKNDFVNVYNQSSLQVPWYIVLGNHDYQGIVDAQLQYNGDPRWNLPSRNYTERFSFGSHYVTFIFLDTSPFILEYYSNPENPQMAIELASQNWKDQFAWFQETISSISSDDWIIVVGHHAILTNDPSKASVELQQNIQPLLEQYNVAAYYSGHVHDLETHHQNGVDYFISGAGSRRDDKEDNGKSLFHQKTAGFMSVSLSKDSMITNVIDDNGSILQTVTTNKPNKRRIY